MGRSNAARARASRALAGLVLACALAFAPCAQADDNVKKPPVRSNHLPAKIGGLTLGLSYLPMGVMGVASAYDSVSHIKIQVFCDSPCTARSNDAAALVIPIFGPFLYASPDARDAVFRPSSPPGTVETTVLMLDGVLQFAGVVTMLVDAVKTKRDEDRVIQAPPSDDWTVIPSASPRGGGLLLSRTF